MQVEEYFVEGWTDQIEEILESDDVPLQNTTGCVATLYLRSRGGTLRVFASPDAGFKDAGEASGPSDASKATVFFQPPAADTLKASEAPYTATWRVEDAANKYTFFPSRKASTWNVRKP